MCPLPARPGLRPPPPPGYRPRRREFIARPVSIMSDHIHMAVPRDPKRQSTSSEKRPIKLRTGLTLPEYTSLIREYERVLDDSGLNPRRYKPSSFLYDRISSIGVDLTAWEESASSGLAYQQYLNNNTIPGADSRRAGDIIATRAARARLQAYKEWQESQRIASALPRDQTAIIYADEYTADLYKHWAQVLGISVSTILRLVLVENLLPDDPSVGMGIKNLTRFYTRILAVADAGEFPPLDREKISKYLCRHCAAPMPPPSS